MKPTYEQLEQQLAEVISERDAAVKAELVWETFMMEACGEDGPASVATEIAALRAQRDTALESLRQQLAAVVAENAGLKQALEYVINPDNQPEYHDQGMGCGVEDHGYQRNGYSACAYGWESAMERVYSEVIPEALPETPATDAYLAEAEARGVDKFATELGHVYQQLRPGSNHAHALKSVVFRAVEFAAQLRQGAKS